MSFSTFSPPRVSTVLGRWHRDSFTPAESDLEAQVITGSHMSIALPIAPELARAAAAPTRTPEQPSETDPVDDFFGVTRPRATRESRHDSHTSVIGDAPPSYADATELPAYTVVPAEPVTLAMYLFKFGFLFPPFWILGAVILLSPLTAPADFEPSKPEAERQQLVYIMRKAEVRWAKRCAWVLLCLLVAGSIIAGICVAVMDS
ncbi:hypothetical protein F5I97DRAFT_1910761 [Phlebopus sp. FC_14]|nr:hypothetical protein F5I97DRAFT_1910761 [Phlebopus sp. FC_14]